MAEITKPVLIAPDAFKHACTAMEAGLALQQGIHRARPALACQLFPLADGGEGTAEILAYHLHAEPRKALVHDALMRPLEVTWYFVEPEKLALIDMAAASGIQLLSKAERNPMHTSTYGTGEVIKSAIEAGAEKILLGIGGSATNDAGMGMAAALGWKFQDAAGKIIPPKGAHLELVRKVIPPKNTPAMEVEVLCDVDNPLCGPDGAAFTYGAQKGASEADVVFLDQGLQHFAGLLEEQFGHTLMDLPGAGAAGGLGAGAVAFLNGKLVSGAQKIMELTGFYKALDDCSLVITGEGRFDGQTKRGKLVYEVAKAASARSVPAVAFCGQVDASPGDWQQMGLQQVRQITPEGMPLEKALRITKALLEQAAFEYFSEKS
ncbi:MAG: glycerate kinase [Saprospirales bacterium]|nr:glycerate kinase [Saprospirales bacterium]